MVGGFEVLVFLRFGVWGLEGGVVILGREDFEFLRGFVWGLGLEAGGGILGRDN